MTRQIPFIGGEYYHIYNRGTNKMKIFNSLADYNRFTKLLYLVNSQETIQFSDTNENSIWKIKRGEPLVEIGAYVLMPNHFHLLIKAKDEESTSLFIQRLLVSHSKYFNKKYDRKGSLFQGKSRSVHIDNDRYLKYLFAYIHLNPVKIIDPDWKESGIKNLGKTIDFLNKYKYSSYDDYAGKERTEAKILQTDAFPEYFKNLKEHINELREWLTFNNS